jgi:uracil-DNA glycosylase family 4
MQPTGHGGMGIMIIAESPGAQEDERGTPLVGPSGQVLRRHLHALGVDLDRDCWKLNTVNCRPPDNREPTSREIEACRSRVNAAIKAHRPRVIILLGAVATGAYLSPYWTEAIDSVARWRGWTIPLNGSWVCPTYHPAFILREEGSLAGVIFAQDLAKAIAKASEPVPPPPTPNDVELLATGPQITSWLASHRGYAAFDFETTGLKPDSKGHRIWSVGVCAEGSGSQPDAAAFRLDNTEAMRALREWLTAPDVHKIAHNVQFEHRWAQRCLGVRVRPWAADSMLDAHLLDNRPGRVCGLKFQAFVQFGVGDYDSLIQPFLRAPDSNSYNTIDRAPQKELLKYNGMDALLTYLLSDEQHKQIGTHENQ